MVQVLSNHLFAALLLASIVFAQSIPTSVLVDTKEGQPADAQPKRKWNIKFRLFPGAATGADANGFAWALEPREARLRAEFRVFDYD